MKSGSLRVRVYAGVDVLTKGPLYLKQVSSAWDFPDPNERSVEAQRIRDGFVRQVELNRQPRTNAPLGQLIDKHLDAADMGRRNKETLRGYNRNHIKTENVGIGDRGRDTEVNADVLFSRSRGGLRSHR